MSKTGSATTGLPEGSSSFWSGAIANLAASMGGGFYIGTTPSLETFHFEVERHPFDFLGTGKCIMPNGADVVITSYSIHYTKLYEWAYWN